MNRNIAKPFVATLSLLDVASDRTHKYKCFHGEDVQLTVKVVGENNKPIDLSNTSVKIYFTLDKNVNEPVYRQDTGIVVNKFGVITVMLEKSYIRIGNNTLKIVLYDEDQTVFLQPLIISCIDPLIGEVADLEIPDDIDVRDELYDIRRIIGDLQDFDDLARNEHETVGERLDNFDSQLDNKASKDEFNIEKTNIKNLSVYVTPKMFGCVGNGVNDDSINLQKAIDYCILNNKKLVGISGEKYGIKQTLIINGFLDIDFSSCEIIDITEVGLNKMLNIKVTAPTVYPKDYYSQNTLILNLQGNGSTNYGIYGEYARNFIIDKTVINNVSKAIEIYQGYEVTIRDFYGCGISSDNSSFGIKICTGDCLIDSAILLDFHTGIWTLSNNYIENVHCWLSRNFNGSIAFRQSDGDCYIDNCYFDSYNYAIYKEKGGQLFINNMRTFYNTDLYTSSFNAPIIFYSSVYPTNVFEYTSLTNSFIKSAVTDTKLHNLSNFIIKDVNNSYELVSYEQVSRINIIDVILEGDCVNSIGRSIQKRLYDSVYTRLRLKSESGFTHNMKIAGLPFKPNDVIYLPCILSDNPYGASNSDASSISYGVITIDTYGGVYLYNPSGVTKNYLFANGVFDIKTF